MTILNQVITIGETMVSLAPHENVGLSYGPSLRMRIAGAESNTAIGICRLGHSAAFISRIGDDSFGQFILRSVRAEGVDTSHLITDTTHPTGIMFKEPRPRMETSVYYYRSDSAASHMSCSDIPEKEIAEARILHFTGITPILSVSCREMAYHAIEIAQTHHCAISFDPNIRIKLWKNQDYAPLMLDFIGRATYLLAGLEELRFLYHTDDMKRIMDKAFSSGTLECLALKDGSNGAFICDKTGIHPIPPADCSCIDPVGAGDAFNAGFLAGILEGHPYIKCGTIGALCGARATESFGDVEGLLTKAELEHTLNHTAPVCR